MELHNVYIVTTGRPVGVFTSGPQCYLLGTARGSTDLWWGGGGAKVTHTESPTLTSDPGPTSSAHPQRGKVFGPSQYLYILILHHETSHLLMRYC